MVFYTVVSVSNTVYEIFMIHLSHSWSSFVDIIGWGSKTSIALDGISLEGYKQGGKIKKDAWARMKIHIFQKGIQWRSERKSKPIVCSLRIFYPFYHKNWLNQFRKKNFSIHIWKCSNKLFHTEFATEGN